jgi:hypothetical protein
MHFCCIHIETLATNAWHALQQTMLIDEETKKLHSAVDYYFITEVSQ